MEKYFVLLDTVLDVYAHKPARTIRGKMRKHLKEQHDVVGGWRYIIDLWKQDRVKGYEFNNYVKKPVIHPKKFERI
tara:strand:- start:230 stop:457 length:228 start_codon:yes stop_codon:yes gene_type:complete